MNLTGFRINSEERIGLSVDAGIIDVAKYLKEAPTSMNDVFTCCRYSLRAHSRWPTTFLREIAGDP